MQCSRPYCCSNPLDSLPAPSSLLESYLLESYLLEPYLLLESSLLESSLLKSSLLESCPQLSPSPASDYFSAFREGRVRVLNGRPLYLFDWPLRMFCPAAMRRFRFPKYFANDYFQRITDRWLSPQSKVRLSMYVWVCMRACVHAGGWAGGFMHTLCSISPTCMPMYSSRMYVQ
jgi:hypothetical protein